ncbi:MAG: TusE/DsrC/DsvC family sulfur relay protein [Pseudomonadales bacterium]|nr:TusE/DsrC/DsvC family sulfur relay protein [Pseudomonadales bacterium]
MLIERDAQGFLRDPSHWTWEFADLVAQELDLVLQDERRQLIELVRRYYQQFGYAPSTRPLIRYAQQELAPDFDSLALARQFPGRSASILAMIAGLPKPPHCL